MKKRSTSTGTMAGNGKSRFPGTAAVVPVLALLLLAAGGCDYLRSEQARLEDARTSYDAGKYNRAAIELKKILRSDERNIDARILLGKIQLWNGQYRQAESQFTKAVAYGAPLEGIAVPMARAYLAVGRFGELLNKIPLDSPPDANSKAELRALRGKAYEALSRPADARAEFEQALKTVPGFGGAYLGLAELALARKDYDEAGRLIARVQTGDDAHVDALLLKARILMERQRFAEAETLFKELLAASQTALTPIEEFRSRTGLAEAQFRLGKTDAAIKSVTALEKRYPQHPMPKYMVALVEYARGNYEESVRHLQSIFQIIPDYPPAQFLMGACHYALNNLEQAGFYLSKAVEIEPDNRQAQKLLAMTYMRLNEPEKATGLLQRSLQSGDGAEDSDLLMMLGQVSLQSGQIDAGLDYIERSVQRSGGNEADLQMELAAAYIAAGKPDLGTGVLDKLPDDGKLAYRKGLLEILASLGKQQVEDARRRAETLLQKYPDDPVILSLAGNAGLLAGKTADAEYFYKRAFKVAPDNPDVLINMGRLSLVQGNVSGATGWFQRALEKKPGDPLALTSLAGIAESKQRYTDAENLLLRAQRANPGNADVDLALLKLYLQRKDFSRAEAFALSALKKAPGQPETVSGLAAALLGQHKVAEAEKTLEDAIQKDGKSTLLHYNLARILLQTGKPEAAKEQLQQALTLAPGSFVLTTQLAVAESRLGHYDRALAIIDDMENRLPDSYRLLALEGDVLMQQKHYRRAIGAYEQAATLKPSTELLVKLYAAGNAAGMPAPEARLTAWLDRHPDDARIRMLLAEHYQSHNNLAAAAEQYERLVEKTPENVLALNNLAWLYHSMRNPRAIEVAEKAHRLRPDKGEIADTLGWILVEQNHLNRGIDMLRDAASKAPEVRDIKYHLAAGLYKQGEAGHARAMLAELLADEQPFPERDAALKLYRTLE
jgi:putative PEP-CTERM system TPR-repeat lipoprotein